MVLFLFNLCFIFDGEKDVKENNWKQGKVWEKEKIDQCVYNCFEFYFLNVVNEVLVIEIQRIFFLENIIRKRKEINFDFIGFLFLDYFFGYVIFMLIVYVGFLFLLCFISQIVFVWFVFYQKD